MTMNMGRWCARIASASLAFSAASSALAATSPAPTGTPTPALSTAVGRNEGLNNILTIPRAGISFLIQNDTALLTGTALPEPLVTNTLTLQPLFPVPLGDMALYVRLFLPLRYLPVPAPMLGDEYAFGLGDSGLLAALVPFPEWPVLVAIGPVFLFPTATNKKVSQEHFQMGPAAGVFYTTSPWFVGVLAEPLFSIGGSAPPVAQMDVQYFLQRSLPGNWQVGMNPDIFFDFKAPEGERVTLPVGLGLWKAVRVGKWPVRFGAEIQYSIIKPQIVGEEWNLRVQITPQIPYPGAEEPSP